jgi:hypothetical protein
MNTNLTAREAGAATWADAAGRPPICVSQAARTGLASPPSARSRPAEQRARTGRSRLDRWTLGAHLVASVIRYNVDSVLLALRRVNHGASLARRTSMIISQHAGKIAALNDKLRTTLDPNSGQVMLTQGVTSLGNAFVKSALAEVKAFNISHGEHDFGSFEIDGRKLFFKIDYYDKDMRYGSEDPSDPSKTARVLTLMLAEEY